MNLQKRLDLLVRLGEYLKLETEEWHVAKQRAFEQNGWFIKEFVDLAVKNIVNEFLNKEKLEAWVQYYHLDDNISQKTVGIVMAGNIPMVGFHDMLSVFVSGHKQSIKLSSKDEVLIKHFIQKLIIFDPEVQQYIQISDLLKGCDAYIATGSNNSARYFDYYFGKYPSLIRRNRTSVAVLTGKESSDELNKLADDVMLYFGLGCRNVTKIYVPAEYDFIPLLNSFGKYSYLLENNKYKNNYDYNLTLLILNKKFYMTNELIILSENEEIFSPIGQLNYSYYTNIDDAIDELKTKESIQAIVGYKGLEFGTAQAPGLFQYADGEDTMQFLLGL